MSRARVDYQAFAAEFWRFGQAGVLGFFADAGVLLIGGVFEDVPRLAPEMLAVHPHPRQQPRPQARHPVPGFMECRSFYSHLGNME